MSRLRLAWAVLCVLATVADDLVTSWLGTRTVRWHVRRLGLLAREVYRRALYGEPSDSREIEIKVYDPDLLEHR